jgi:uncharacterized membrane protein YfcA
VTEGLLFGLLLVAEVLGTIGGFGSSMLVMPLAAFFLPFDQALGLTALFHVFSNAAKIMLFRTGLDRRLLLTMGVPAVVGVVLGARLTAFLPGATMELLLSVALMLLAVLLLVLPRIHIEPSTRNAGVGGAASGFIAGLVGTGGAIRGLTMAAFDLEKNVFVSTSAWIDLGVDLSRTAVYAGQGYFTDLVWLYLPGMAVVSLTGTWIGRWILGRVSQERFRRIVLVLVVLVALFGATRALGALVG